MPSLIGSTVTANYLKAAPSTQFGTRELTIVKIAVAVTDLFTGQSAANSNYAAAVRALQLTAEVYAVYAAQNDTADFFHAIIATDTQTNGDSTTNGVPTGTGYGILEAAMGAALGQTVTITVATLS